MDFDIKDNELTLNYIGRVFRRKFPGRISHVTDFDNLEDLESSEEKTGKLKTLTFCHTMKPGIKTYISYVIDDERIMEKKFYYASKDESIFGQLKQENVQSRGTYREIKKYDSFSVVEEINTKRKFIQILKDRYTQIYLIWPLYDDGIILTGRRNPTLFNVNTGLSQIIGRDDVTLYVYKDRYCIKTEFYTEVRYIRNDGRIFYFNHEFSRGKGFPYRNYIFAFSHDMRYFVFNIMTGKNTTLSKDFVVDHVEQTNYNLSLKAKKISRDSGLIGKIFRIMSKFVLPDLEQFSLYLAVLMRK